MDVEEGPPRLLTVGKPPLVRDWGEKVKKGVPRIFPLRALHIHLRICPFHGKWPHHPTEFPTTRVVTNAETNAAGPNNPLFPPQLRRRM